MAVGNGREGRYLATGDEAGTAPGDRKYRPDVQGLRAVAILLVLLYHFEIPGFKGGFVGVDVFFVVSGFVITGLLMRERAQGTISVADFFARRCRRIIPIASTVLVLSVALERITAGRTAAHALGDPARWILLFVFNWNTTAVATMLYANNPVSIYWSLSVEEQFYLVYPVLLIGVALVGSKWNWRAKASVVLVVITVLSFAWAVRLTSQLGLSLGYTSTLARVWELGLGCLLALNISRLLRLDHKLGAIISWLGVGMILLSGITYDLNGSFSGWPAILPAIGATLVITGGTPVPMWGPEVVLGSRPFRLIGDWSYGMYLWEIPVLLLVTYWWQSVHDTPLGLRAVFLVSTMALAALSYRWFEAPIRHLPALVSRPRVTLLTALGVTLAGILVVTVLGA